MKKASRIIVAIVLSIAILFALSMSACYIPLSKNETTYDIVINVDDTVPTGKTFSQIVYEARTCCVDVYAGNTFGRNGSAGSGVIFGASKTGTEYYIITNHHVIDDQNSFRVTLLFIDGAGNESNADYEAELIGSSKSNDIAVLRIAKQGLETISVATFGDSSKIKVGNDVFAIGNPLGVLGGTVSKGIISATERLSYVEGIGNMRLIQTDTATYQGSSGGALFNEYGKVIGITNAGYSEYDGLNFAIPSNVALNAAEKILGTVEKNASGNVTSFGYVAGESQLGISTGDYVCYDGYNSYGSVAVVSVMELTDNSDAKDKLVSYQACTKSSSTNYFHSIKSIEYKPETGNRREVDVTSSDQAQEILNNVQAGTSITIKARRVIQVLPGDSIYGANFYYLSDQTELIQIDVTQFKHTLPTA